MEQHDIRKLFKGEEDLTKKLPDNHSAAFLVKLKARGQSKTNRFLVLKIAAVLVIGIMISYSVFQNQNSEVKSPLLAQIEAVEAEYLKNIDAEWHNFLTLAKDESLIKRYKEKLSDLDADYQEVSTAFKENTNNILVVESLVENLQTRLSLLKDIQAHIKILNKNSNQKNEQHENTI